MIPGEMSHAFFVLADAGDRGRCREREGAQDLRESADEVPLQSVRGDVRGVLTRNGALGGLCRTTSGRRSE